MIVLNPDGLNKIKSLKEFKPVIFYLYTDRSILKNRLLHRGDNQEEIKRRLENDDYDFMCIEDKVDFMIRNDGNLCPANIADIILNIYLRVVERCVYNEH